VLHPPFIWVKAPEKGQDSAAPTPYKNFIATEKGRGVLHPPFIWVIAPEKGYRILQHPAFIARHSQRGKVKKGEAHGPFRGGRASTAK
jgi:hypothetical protein